MTCEVGPNMLAIITVNLLKSKRKEKIEGKLSWLTSG